MLLKLKKLLDKMKANLLRNIKSQPSPHNSDELFDKQNPRCRYKFYGDSCRHSSSSKFYIFAC